MRSGPLLTVWDERYGAPGFAYGTEPNAFLADVAPRLPPGIALSLGEGEGRNAVFLATGGWRVIAVDRSRVGLAKARVLAAERRVDVSACVVDLAAFPLPAGHFDVIVAIFCHLPPIIRRGVHAAAVRALRPGGAFVLEAYTPAQLAFGTGGPPTRELLMTVADLRGELAGLDLAIAREVERDVTEGRMHHGRSAVVQVLGFRPNESA
jgi:SAM-dependent methyltransferase